MLNLDPAPKIITFDCYGTIVQWFQAMNRAAMAILSKRPDVDAAADAATLVADLRAAAVAQQMRAPYRGYKTILTSSLGQALARRGDKATADDEAVLLSILGAIPPHPDSPDALRRLRERYRIAIISNTDDDLIAGTVAAIGVPIDHLITAQQAQAYKPDHRLFEYAHAAMGVTREETIHVGMGQFTDLKVCHELGIRSVWINRMGETLDPAWSADAVLPDLTGLPALLGAV